MINSDLRNSFPFSANEGGLEGSANAISFFTLAGAFRENRTTQDYAHVSYKLDEGQLFRLCRRNKDSIDSGAQTKAQVAASDLAELSFSYAEFNQEKQALEWKDTWDKSSFLL